MMTGLAYAALGFLVLKTISSAYSQTAPAGREYVYGQTTKATFDALTAVGKAVCGEPSMKRQMIHTGGDGNNMPSDRWHFGCRLPDMRIDTDDAGIVTYWVVAPDKD